MLLPRVRQRCYERNSVCYVRNMGDSKPEWHLLSISTGRDASLRVFVWRKLRKLGAVYFHQSVCLLPNLPRVTRAIDPVVARIRSQGGRVRILTVALHEHEHEALAAEQRDDRDDEYGEVVERVPQFLAEIEMETARGRATYAEVEESEADLERFEKWLASIADRDYFEAPRGADARLAVQKCRQALAGFEALAVAADTDDDGAAGRFNLTVVEN
jgi:Protein ChrB, N-terminal